MNTKHIAIVGAGIAGIALAILATRQGHKVSLFERNSLTSNMGAGITLWPNALFVLQKMGLSKEIITMGGAPHSMHQFNQFGVKQGTLDINTANTLSGFPSVTLLRRDLMNIMVSELNRLKIKTYVNHTISPQDINDFKLAFDLVVGADGRMNSVVRQSIYSERVTPCYQGFINIIGTSSLKQQPSDIAICDFRGQKQRFGIVPIKNDQCFWAGAWNTDIDKTRTLPSWHEEMNQRFQHWPKPVQDVLKAYDRTSLNHLFVHDINPLPYWHKGNTLIIGDAAHASLPTSGQGASQALEDAWHLTKTLREHLDLEQALHAFYQLRIRKTSASQSIGRQLAQQIFSPSVENTEAPASILTTPPEALSQFWMQELESR